MKKLKKLTRKGLDELANEMPQVNEIQQRECVGGAIYYDRDGNYLGSVGETDYIRVCTSLEFSTLDLFFVQDPTDPEYMEDHPQFVGNFFNIESSNVQQNILDKYFFDMQYLNDLLIGSTAYGENQYEISENGVVTLHLVSSFESGISYSGIADSGTVFGSFLTGQQLSNLASRIQSGLISLANS